MGLGMGKPYLAQLPSRPLNWPHGARKASWTWYPAAGLPAKYPGDTPPDTWILPLFLGKGTGSRELLLCVENTRMCQGSEAATPAACPVCPV